MTDQTQSEKRFEQFCADASIQCCKVPRHESKRTPDYVLTLGGLTVLTEVKEIERNPEERESDRLLESRGYGNAIGSVPGQKVRDKIRSCSAQIKARTQGTHPGLLVLYEAHFAGVNINPYQILVAMYGLETHIFAVPENEPPYLIHKKLGPKQKMTPRDNTSISAIATLHRFQSGEMKLRVYHNRFAAIPIASSVLAPYRIDQYRIAELQPGKVPQWECVS